MTLISFQSVSKVFGDFVAVDDVSFDIEEGEFFSLLGPSGCGKTTLLRMLAGLEIPTSGKILIDGTDVATLPAGKRGVNMVFQSYAVFPHMTVAKNVAYGLKMDGIGKREREIRAKSALEMVQLNGFGDRLPDQLSGGQKQRVAIARALVKNPKVLLLDEPLSALDAKLRESMRNELVQLQQETGVTFVMVTHDQSEALATADRCAVMKDGKLEQVASPTDLYENPANAFIADFIGTINMLHGKLSINGSDVGQVACPDLETNIYVDCGTPNATNGDVRVGIRPEKVTMTPKGAGMPAAPGANQLDGRIVSEAYLGSESLFEIQCGQGLCFKVRRSNDSRADGSNFEPGEQVCLSWSPSASIVFRT